ncbi:MAG TPA: hypothetical protein VGG03_15475 [Thermoanaerobaculia bacterium]|jgi:ABC-type multidrug transport system fused ATPase/permease subunit
MALARALLHRPAILLLDEATSALDTVTERRIHEELRRLRATHVVIAHRLSTVVHADRILALEEGRITAQGTHREFLERSPTYAELAQASEAIEPEGEPILDRESTA